MKATIVCGALIAIAFHAAVLAQEKVTVTFTEAVVTDRTGKDPRPPGERLDLALVAEVSAPAAVDDLRICLSQTGVLQFVTDWPAAEGLSDMNADAPPFVRSSTPPDVKPRGGQPLVVSVTYRGDGPSRFRNTLKFDFKGKEKCDKFNFTFNQWDVVRDGLLIDSGPGQEKLPPFKAKFQMGANSHGATLEFAGAKLVSGGAGSSTSVTTLEVSGKLPIGKPDDIRNTPGAKTDASTQVADALMLSYNIASYRPGGRLEKIGARLRTTGSLKGAEVTGYWAPLFGWFNDSRGFYGAEVEAGYRRGDAEFSNLVTVKPDVGHAVARLGAVVEWAPNICIAADRCINGNLSQGLRFFIRGRGWLDTYRDPAGDTKVRFRPYLDSELFYNFSADSRIFLRAEKGYLPPDLSTKTKRVYVGTGIAF